MGSSSTQTVRQEIDPWLRGEWQGLYDRAVPYANMGYQDPGNGVAAMQPMQRAAQDFLSQNLLGQSYAPYSPYSQGMRWPMTAPAPRTGTNYPTFQPPQQGEIGGPGTPKPGDGYGQGGQPGGNGDPGSPPEARMYGRMGFGAIGATGGYDDPYAQVNQVGGWNGMTPEQTLAANQAYQAAHGTFDDGTFGPAASYGGGAGVYAGGGDPFYPGRPPFGGGFNVNTGPFMTPGSAGTYTPPAYTPQAPVTSPGSAPTGAYQTYGAGNGASTGIAEARDASSVARSIAGNGFTPMVQTGNVVPGMNSYRDPYENQVVSQALGDIDRSRQLATQGDRAQATMAGAFGGDRSAILEAETNRAYADQAARTASQLRSQGFSRAADLAQQDAARGLTGQMANQQAYFTGRNQQLQGAGLLSSFGGDMLNRTIGTAQALSGAGGQQQAQSQAELDDQMNRFYEARDYPQQQMAFLQSMLSGQPYNQTQSIPNARNRGAGFAGGALSGAGIGSAFGPWGAAAGAGIGGLLGLF